MKRMRDVLAAAGMAAATLAAGAFAQPGRAAGAPRPQVLWAAGETGEAGVPLSFRDGARKAEISYALSEKIFSDDHNPGMEISSDQKIFLKQAGHWSWEGRSYFEFAASSVTAGQTQRLWSVAAEFPGGNEVYYESKNSARPMVERVEYPKGRPQQAEKKFYEGAPGLPFFVKLCADETRAAAADARQASGGQLSAADRDEVATSAFYQVFGVPAVADVKHDPDTGDFAVSIRGTGQFAGELFIKVTLRGTGVPAAGADAFAKWLKKNAAPMLKLSYEPGRLVVQKAQLRLGNDVYAADVSSARPLDSF